MFDTGMIVISIVGLIVWAFILHGIIRDASRANHIVKIEIDQLAILMLIAEKLGASVDEIDKLITVRSLKKDAARQKR